MVPEDVAWADLAVLLEGIRTGSLNRAAQALGISQSTASRRVARLERGLGARVFDRTPEGLKPTDLALRIAPHAELVADRMVDIQRLAAEQEARPRGRVRLAVVDGMAPVLLAPALAGFYDAFPDIELDLLAAQSVVDLVRGEADIALRMVFPTAPDLVVRKLGEMELALFAHPDLTARPDGVHRFVALADPRGVFPESHWLQSTAPDAHVTRVTSWNVLFACALQGVGAALLSPSVAEPAGLVRIAGPPVPSRPLYVVYHRVLRDVPKIVAVRDWLVQTVESLGGRENGAPEMRGGTSTFSGGT